jgi:hypothetical protein
MVQKRRDDGGCDSFGKKIFVEIFFFFFFFFFFPFLPSILFGSGNRETEEQL